MGRRYISRRERFDILTRCNYACFYCGTPAQLGLVQLEIEHVVPVSQGGTNEPWNLVAACVPCNAGKAADPPPPSAVAAAVDLYMDWTGRSTTVRRCTNCQRPWIPDADDEEPADQCWPCIFSWCDGLDYARKVSE